MAKYRFKSRSQDTLANGGRRCVALNQVDPGHDAERCNRAATLGHSLCATHLRARRRIDNPHQFVITMNFKPHPRTSTGTHSKCVIGKTFATEELANEYLRLCWGLITRDRANRRFVSACVEPRKRILP